MMTDPVADFLIQLKNASSAGRAEVTLPHSNMKEALARILAKEGYLGSVSVAAKEKGKKQLKVQIRYQAKQPVIHEVQNVSTPGRRVYAGYTQIPKVLGGMGIVLISTPHGIMSGKQAKKEKIGGELLCKIW